MKSTFARRMSILLVLAMVLAMLPVAALAATSTTLYLKPGPWNTANAWYSAYFYVDDTTNTHAAMADTDGDGVYEVTVPEGDWTNVIFLRNDPADQVADWNGVWNQTADLAMPTDGTNMYTVTGWNAGDGAWSEYVYVEPAFYVCGTMNSWTLSYADHKMVKGDDGVYSLTLTLAAGTYEFKVNDGTWGSSWGKDGGANNIEFVLTEESNVTITFDLATKVPVVTSSAMGEVETFDYYLRGSMNEWTVSSATGMVKNDDGTYSITIDMVAGTYEYKADSGDWTDCYPVVGEPNATVTVATDCAVTFTLDTTAGTITATGDGLGETPVDPDPEPVVVTSAAVKGTIPGMTWVETDETGIMTLVDGIYTITIPAVPASEVGAAAYAFKVVANGSWDTAYPADDWTFYLKSECDVTITFNPETYEVTLTADGLTYDAPTEGGDPVDPVVSYYVTGTPELTGGAGWLANEFLMVAGENGTYTYTFTALAAGNYSLKVTDGTWNNSWTAASGSEYLAADGNLTFTVTAACDVVVTFDGTSVSVAGENVTAKAPELLVVDKVVVAGGAAEEGADQGEFLYGQNWVVDSMMNGLFPVEEDSLVYSTTYLNVAAGSYAFKFFLNDSSSINFASGVEVVSGVEADAWFNAMGNSILNITEDGATVEFILDLTNVTYVGDNAKMTVNITYPEKVESKAPESMVIGDNEFATGTGDTSFITSTFTATESGTLMFEITYLNMFDSYTGEWSECPAQYIGMQGRGFGLMVNGENFWPNGTIEVVAGETYEIGVASYQGNASEIVVTLSWYVPTCDHKYAYSFDATNNLHTFTCDYCGDVFTKEGTSATALKFRSAAPLLGDCINVEFGIYVPEGFENPYVIFEFNGEESYEDAYYVNAAGRNVYEFKGINPQTIGDNICSTVYAFVDGELVYLTYATYSVRTYCINQLGKATTPAALKTLIADLLIFGEKTQIMQSYKLDQMITEGVDLSAYASTFPGLGTEFNKQAMVGTANSNVGFKGVTLTLSGKMTIVVSLTADDISKYTFQAEVNGVVTTYQPEDLVYNAASGRYELSFDKMKASAFDDVITFSILENGVVTSKQLQYTVNTYIQKNQAVASGDMLALLQAIYNYGAAAKALNG